MIVNESASLWIFLLFKNTFRSDQYAKYCYENYMWVVYFFWYLNETVQYSMKALHLIV